MFFDGTGTIFRANYKTKKVMSVTYDTTFFYIYSLIYRPIPTTVHAM